MLGGRVSHFPRRFEDGCDLDPEIVAASLTRRTRLLILTNPHNPSGAVIAPDRLRRGRSGWPSGTALPVLIDEVYRDVLLDERPPPAATLSEACVSTNSLTKAYGLSLAALRLGPRLRGARAKDAAGARSHRRLEPDSLRPPGDPRLPEPRARCARARGPSSRPTSRWSRNGSPATPQLECVVPRATLAFPRLRGAADAGPFVESLFARSGTAVAPGHFFGAPAHFRIAFGGDSRSCYEASKRSPGARPS